MDLVEHLDEFCDVIVLSDLQALAEAVDDDLKKWLVGLLELWTHLLDRFSEQLDLYGRTVLRADELVHHTIKERQFQVVTGHQWLFIQCSQLSKYQIMFLFVAEEKQSY